MSTFPVYISYKLQGASADDFMGAVVDHKTAKELTYIIAKHLTDLLDENARLESTAFEFDGYDFTAQLNLYNVTQDQVKAVSNKFDFKQFSLTVETDHLGESEVEYALDMIVA